MATTFTGQYFAAGLTFCVLVLGNAFGDLVLASLPSDWFLLCCGLGRPRETRNNQNRVRIHSRVKRSLVKYFHLDLNRIVSDT